MGQRQSAEVVSRLGRVGTMEELAAALAAAPDARVPSTLATVDAVVGVYRRLRSALADPATGSAHSATVAALLRVTAAVLLCPTTVTPAARDDVGGPVLALVRANAYAPDIVVPGLTALQRILAATEVSYAPLVDAGLLDAAADAARTLPASGAVADRATRIVRAVTHYANYNSAITPKTVAFLLATGRRLAAVAEHKSKNKSKGKSKQQQEDEDKLPEEPDVREAYEALLKARDASVCGKDRHEYRDEEDEDELEEAARQEEWDLGFVALGCTETFGEAYCVALAQTQEGAAALWEARAAEEALQALLARLLPRLADAGVCGALLQPRTARLMQPAVRAHAAACGLTAAAVRALPRLAAAPLPLQRALGFLVNASCHAPTARALAPVLPRLARAVVATGTATPAPLDTVVRCATLIGNCAGRGPDPDPACVATAAGVAVFEHGLARVLTAIDDAKHINEGGDKSKSKDDKSISEAESDAAFVAENPEYACGCLEHLALGAAFYLADDAAHARLCTPALRAAVAAADAAVHTATTRRAVQALARTPDPAAARAVAAGLCTCAAVPPCADCACTVRRVDCARCCVVQRVWVCACLPPDRCRVCATCRAHHAGHTGRWLFTATRCRCPEPVPCQISPPPDATPQGIDNDQQ